MKCEFCGFEFHVEDCRSGCAGCPMNKTCKKIKCPNCNYEMHPEPELRALTALKKWSKKIWKK